MQPVIPTTMTAMRFDRFGDPVEVIDAVSEVVPEPGPGEALVAVAAVSINAYDWHVVAASPAFVRLAGFGLRRPKHTMPGHDLAGTVVAVGPGVDRLSVGDRVVGWRNGAAAEFVTVAADRLVRLAAETGFGEAASLPMAGFTALQAVRDHAGVERANRVLVLGASGGVGQFVVQLAKAAGAHVTGVCGTHNVETVRALGADEVVDYGNGGVDDLAGPFDVVFHVNGSYPLGRMRRVMAPDGVMVVIGADEGGALLGPARFIFAQVMRSWFTSQRVVQFTAHNSAADLEHLVAMLEAGELSVAVDRLVPLAAIGEAISELRRGHARGKVVIEVAS